ncbi:bifunctional 4-hydroxy-2-oxoglutarate aldolase/2-dehydro-3-deoxy-phosphogluconate aldolase [Scopulibacillus cellulosilyticus]|uniref:Bifunctional 4-hydroxy-2-oxoglutarate aldolase/2-dehydro-3-deoxy-phosphogluconate aldolase n=1 Tax=Scopulibacillus cellulosilyticus TaxID=2665665 RepID=A0ABW2Q4I9_9BACL
MDTLSKILENKIIAIIRGVDSKKILPVARALNKGGIKLVEVTLNTPHALDSIKQLNEEMGEEMAIGAGTVLDPETARQSLLAGAAFIISPSLDIDTIKMTKRYGAVSIPGAYTPTEILKAYESGADIVKVFPADSVGPAFVKGVKGPLPQIPLAPTGGVNLSNAADYIKAGACAVGIGGSLVPSNIDTSESSLNELIDKAKQYVQAVQNI